MSNISFFNEDIEFSLQNEPKISNWLVLIINNEGFSLSELNYIFCSDEYLYKMNLDYLGHDTYTDIITFDNSEDKNIIEGDIFISVDRVKENNELFQATFDDELNRVIVHGLLHLLGHDDKTEKQKSLMRKKEEACLSLLPIN